VGRALHKYRGRDFRAFAGRKRGKTQERDEIGNAIRDEIRDGLTRAQCYQIFHESCDIGCDLGAIGDDYLLRAAAHIIVNGHSARVPQCSVPQFGHNSRAFDYRRRARKQTGA